MENVHKKEDKSCEACRFWYWFEERQQYGCDIKGCWEKSKFQTYDPFNPKHNA